MNRPPARFALKFHFILDAAYCYLWGCLLILSPPGLVHSSTSSGRMTMVEYDWGDMYVPGSDIFPPMIMTSSPAPTNMENRLNHNVIDDNSLGDMGPSSLKFPPSLIQPDTFNIAPSHITNPTSPRITSTRTLVPSTQPSVCVDDDGPDALFFLKTNENDKNVMRRCRWLRELSTRTKDRICAKTEAPDPFHTAREMCRSTCSTCPHASYPSQAPTTMPSLPPGSLCSFPHCANGENCAKKICSDCPFNCYKREPKSCPLKPKQCNAHCTPEDTSHDVGCKHCIFSKPRRKCDLGTFRDITSMIFSGEDSDYWNQWSRPGKPRGHFTSANMVDVNGDSVLDFFTPFHGGFNEDHQIQLGLTSLNHTSGDDVDLDKRTTTTTMHLTDVSSRIILDDPWDNENGYSIRMDKHGGVVVDLDNDGILDILISSGGGRGGKFGDLEYPESRDNLIFFGEKVKDEETGKEITVYRGGRHRSLAAGLESRWGRGRYLYLLDVNGDGLLDIFAANNRRADNHLAPGALFINQGNRTWRKDPGMSEFAETMILTDADGDSIVEEVMVIRGTCFPDRSDPNFSVDHGPFPDNVKEFCSTRPVGSTAVYKFNNATQQMEEISPKYFNVSAEKSMQPQCCPHGLYNSYEFGCTAASIASADLDGDGRVDHVLLYNRRMEFFFSSGRPAGELPIEKKYVGLSIDLPGMCIEAISIRIVDMNNSGKLDILIMCSNVGTFLIYSQGDEKNEWKLRRNCNAYGSLGDIVFGSFNITQDDIEDACLQKGRRGRAGEICEQYETNGKVDVPDQKGLTLADINNDGFLDVIVSTYVGYTKFFLYQPSRSSIRNRHISFRLIGDGKDVNRYGIGATLTLIARNSETQQFENYFKEISSYQHTTERRGYLDEKIGFGLNDALTPERLVVKWPNGIEQTLWLQEFDTTTSVKPLLYPAIDVTYSAKNHNFRIRNKKVSDSGQNLCLSNIAAPKPTWARVRLVDCAEEDSLGATYFSFNEWGMLESFSSPGLCLINMPKKDEVWLNGCETTRVKHSSWHLQTRDGVLRFSGSDKLLGIEKALVGQKPRLTSIDIIEEEELTQWFLDQVPEP